MNKDLIKLKEIINSSNNIVFFGGAGVSTDSGLKEKMDYTKKNMKRVQNTI